MRKRKIGTCAAALAAMLLLCGTASGQEKPKPEFYSAVWAGVGGSLGGSTMPINIRINRFNTDEEIKKYAAILAKDGPDRLRRVLEDEDVGQVSPVGRVGTPLAIARKLRKGDKIIVRVATARNMSFVELRRSGRSTDYPYTILELVLDENGQGMGTAIGAAKIRFDKKKNTYEIESFQHGTAYNKLLNVRLMK